MLGHMGIRPIIANSTPINNKMRIQMMPKKSPLFVSDHVTDHMEVDVVILCFTGRLTLPINYRSSKGVTCNLNVRYLAVLCLWCRQRVVSLFVYISTCGTSVSV